MSKFETSVVGRLQIKCTISTPATTFANTAYPGLPSGRGPLPTVLFNI
eukprot:CAMPEP_0168521262 /NCGR_PEP_ID=MMETSP0405-20121227/8552_1 /TAXON_ID=498012 /ORGANISM="Trichosphaerium sp, Strain Am-I-7 wt" /LENGTH=47 /DNA_ID= /DNA_START= /DNA_END= /DNA_ORIENTATION=